MKTAQEIFDDEKAKLLKSLLKVMDDAEDYFGKASRFGLEAQAKLYTKPKKHILKSSKKVDVLILEGHPMSLMQTWYNLFGIENVSLSTELLVLSPERNIPNGKCIKDTITQIIESHKPGIVVLSGTYGSTYGTSLISIINEVNEDILFVGNSSDHCLSDMLKNAGCYSDIKKGEDLMGLTFALEDFEKI